MTQVPPDPAPRYDDVFFGGLSALNRLACEPIAEEAGEATLDEDGEL